MDKRYSINKYNFSGLLLAAGVIYYLLISDLTLPFSIHSVLGFVHNLANTYPVLAVGILPIYVGCVIFGISTLGYYLGSVAGQMMTRFSKPARNE